MSTNIQLFFSYAHKETAIVLPLQATTKWSMYGRCCEKEICVRHLAL